MRTVLPLLRPVVAAAIPLAVLACVAATSRRPAPAPVPAPEGPWIWVSNEGSGDLALVDAAAGAVVARVPVGARPRGLRLDREGGLLYAAVSGAPAGAEPSPLRSAADMGAAGIAVVDVATRQVVSILPSGQDPEALDLVPGERLLVVSSVETASAAVVDLDGGRVAARVGVGAEPGGVTAAPHGGIVAVAGARRLDLLDPVAGRVVARVPTCARPRGVVFTPDGALAFAACEEGAAVAVVDVAARALAGEIALPEGSRPTGLALAPDGRRLFVSNGRAGTVSAVDVPSRRVIGTSAPIGESAGGIAVAPDGASLYVADAPANTVEVLDARSLALVRRIPVGERPSGLAVATAP